MNERMRRELKEVYYKLSEAEKLYAKARVSPDEDMLWAVYNVASELSDQFHNKAKKGLRSVSCKDGSTLVYGSYVVLPRDIITDMLYILEEATSEDRTGYRNKQPSFSDLARSYEKD